MVRTNKRVEEIKGELGYQAEKGYRAFIKKTNGETIMTSQVVDVRNETADGIEIETQNTVYKLTYVPGQSAA